MFQHVQNVSSVIYRTVSANEQSAQHRRSKKKVTNKTPPPTEPRVISVLLQGEPNMVLISLRQNSQRLNRPSRRPEVPGTGPGFRRR